MRETAGYLGVPNSTIHHWARPAGGKPPLITVFPRRGAQAKRITYGSDGWASQLRLPAYQRAEVVVDPWVAFGLPLVVHGGARVEDLVDRFVAGDTVADIAYDFGVPPEEVEDVIRVAARTAA